MKVSGIVTFTAFTLVSVVVASPLGAVGHASDDLRPIYTPPNVFGDGNDMSAMGNDDGIHSHIIKDSYIVVLKSGKSHHLPLHLDGLKDWISDKTSQLTKRGLFNDVVDEIAHHFSVGDFTGYGGKFSQDTLEWIRRHPAVDFVERDSVVKAMDIERGAPWGLARISHRPALRLGTLGKYEYAHKGGEGVDVYVIDTGVNIKHVELEGRATWGKTMPKDEDVDANGHGSHVAGTIASAKYGVAKDANIIAVKVLGSSGSGSMLDVVGGVAWAAQQASSKMESQAAKNGTHKGSVANMSLGGGKSQALDLAVNNAVKKGLHFAVAAGNDNRDACAYSPAAAENAITVGASTIADKRAYFSNWGKCVDLFAPGLNILSIWNTGDHSVNTISGTSMASPHIAGLTAYYLSLYPSGEFAPTVEDYEAAGVPVPTEEQEANGRSLFQIGSQFVFGKKPQVTGGFKPLNPKVLKSAMLRLSTKNALDDISSDTPNLLAFNNFTTSSTKAVKVEPEEEIFHAQPIYEKGQDMVNNAVEELEDMIEEILENAEEQWFSKE